MARSDFVLQGECAEAMRKLEEYEGDLNEYYAQVDRNWKAYKGIPEIRSRVTQDTTNKMTPPYIMHIIETMLAAMLDPKLKFDVKPRPKLYEPGELEVALKGADAHEDLLAFQLEQAQVDEKKRSFVLQERVTGLSVLKVYWHTSTKRKIRLQEEPVEGTPYGRLVGQETIEKAYDGPQVDVVDVKDFVFDLSSANQDRCPFMAQRVWMSKQELQAFERAGVYKNVDMLQESQAANQPDEKTKKFKDRFEIWEIWVRKGDGQLWVYTVGNRNVELSSRPSPFDHNEMPFVLFSAQSVPFRLIGTSQVQKLTALQEMLWGVSNSRLDALEFANLGMIFVNEDLEDPESIKFESGAINQVRNPADVQVWTPNPTAAQVSMPAEQMIKQDMQNLAGGQPFTSTGEARTAQANTATEASLVANIAQQNLQSAKTILGYAWRRMGEQMMQLNQQFIRDDIAVKVIDIDTDPEKSIISPLMLQGDFTFVMEPQDESLMRQEKRAENMALFNSLVQAAPLLMQIAGAGYMKPLDYEKVVKDLLESYDKDADTYFKAAPPPQQAIPGQAPGTPPGPQQPQPPGNGITNPQLAAGQQSPSNENSMSPVSQLQQFAAAGMGGGRN